MKTCPETLAHNTKIIRFHLATWGKERIILGDLSQWKEAAHYESFPKDLKRLDLWLDSTDFRLSGRRSSPRSDTSWSYKCNSLGCRYTFLSDAQGRIRKLWGIWSKDLRRHVFRTACRMVGENLKGAQVITDTHFEGARNT